GEFAVHRLGAFGQHRGLVETAHLQGVVHHRALAVQGERPAGLAGDPPNPSIDVRGGRAVELELALDGPATLFQGGEIEEAEVYAALDFQRFVAAQEDARAGRLDLLPLGTAAQEGGDLLRGRSEREEI